MFRFAHSVTTCGPPFCYAWYMDNSCCCSVRKYCCLLLLLLMFFLFLLFQFCCCCCSESLCGGRHEQMNCLWFQWTHADWLFPPSSQTNHTIIECLTLVAVVCVYVDAVVSFAFANHLYTAIQSYYNWMSNGTVHELIDAITWLICALGRSSTRVKLYPEWVVWLMWMIWRRI